MQHPGIHSTLSTKTPYHIDPQIHPHTRTNTNQQHAEYSTNTQYPHHQHIYTQILKPQHTHTHISNTLNNHLLINQQQQRRSMPNANSIQYTQSHTKPQYKQYKTHSSRNTASTQHHSTTNNSRQIHILMHQMKRPVNTPRTHRHAHTNTRTKSKHY